MSRTLAVGIVVPVHDEEELLARALAAIDLALEHPHLAGVERRVAVVLDACTDASAAIAEHWRAAVVARSGAEGAVGLVNPVVLQCNDANVGAARGRGCAALLRAWAGSDPHRVWLATTDADSEVPPAWLATQVARHEEGTDIWTGTVTVADWSQRAPGTGRKWHERYRREELPLHGTSMGVNAGVYLAAGGFDALATGEDRALHGAIVAGGASAHHDRSVPVMTSARSSARAPAGFAHALAGIESEAAR